MGDPGNKASKDSNRRRYPRRARGEDLNWQRDTEIPRSKARGLDKNWAATGTQGSAADAEPMHPRKEPEREKRDE